MYITSSTNDVRGGKNVVVKIMGGGGQSCVVKNHGGSEQKQCWKKYGLGDEA